MKSKFFFFVSRPSTPQKFHSLIFDLLAFSGKIFLREKIPTRFLSPFCNLLFFLFQKHFFGNFLLWTDWNFSSPWEEVLHFGTSLLPGRMVYILELLFSLGKWFSFSTRINLSSQIGGVSLEFHEGGYVKKATRKQRFAQCVDIDFVPVFLNFGQLLFSIK